MTVGTPPPGTVPIWALCIQVGPSAQTRLGDSWALPLINSLMVQGPSRAWGGGKTLGLCVCLEKGGVAST